MPDSRRKTTQFSLAIITAVLLISLYISPSKAIANTAPNTDTTISKADHEAMITTAKDYFIDTTNKILWITAVIVTVTLALAGLLFPYVMEKRRDTINKSLLEKLETQLQSYSKDQADKALEKSEESLTTALQAVQKVLDNSKKTLSDDIERKAAELSNRIFIEQASRYINSADQANERAYSFACTMYYLHAVNSYLSAKSFNSAYHYLQIAIRHAAKAIKGDALCAPWTYDGIDEQSAELHASLAKSDHYDKFSPLLSELSKLVPDIKEHTVVLNYHQPTQQTPDESDKTE